MTLPDLICRLGPGGNDSIATHVVELLCEQFDPIEPGRTFRRKWQRVIGHVMDGNLPADLVASLYRRATTSPGIRRPDKRFAAMLNQALDRRGLTR